jgi:hypothetical protein
LAVSQPSQNPSWGHLQVPDSSPNLDRTGRWAMVSPLTVLVTLRFAPARWPVHKVQAWRSCAL